MGIKLLTMTDKQKFFCQEYLVDLNAKRAAISAGYSKNTAEQQGSRLLSNVKLQRYITKLKKRRSKRTQIEADAVIKELAIIAFSNINDFITIKNERIELKPIEDMVQSKVNSISELVNTPNGIRLKLHDKISALTKLGQHLGLFSKKIDIINCESKPSTINKVIINHRV